MASLEELKKRLYKEKETFGERMVKPELARPGKGGAVFWSEQNGKIKGSRWFFWALGICLVLIVLGALFFVFGSPALFRSQAVDVKIEGLTEIKSGDKISWQVKVTNKGNAALGDAVLVFKFPKDSAPVAGRKQEKISRERRALGDVRPGESVIEIFNAFVFGGKGAEKEVSAVLEYRPAGASAVFAEGASFQFSIARSPVAVSFNLPQELRIGQEVEFEANYSSQADETIPNLFLQINFPDGFELISANPNSLSQNKNIWALGDLSPSRTGKIKLKGVVRGADLESKIFKAAVGIFDPAENSIMPYDASSQTVVLRSPFLSVNILANGLAEYTTFPGDTISFDVLLKNNLPQEVKNASLEIIISGSAVDFNSLRVERGAFRESSKSIVWNSSTFEPLRILLPNQEENVVFSFKVKNNLALSADSPRPTIRLNAIFKPGSAVHGFEGVDVAGSVNYEIKASSKLQVITRALFYNSIIQNVGPLPPKVGEETTYTIVWSLANMVNDLDGVVVKSSLPPYMNFKNVIQPADADMSFDKSSGEIIWRAGRVLAGTGFLRPALQAAFQVGLLPSQNQVGSSPVIINATETSGRDTFTNQTLSSRDDQITIELPDDPNITFNQKKVVQ